MKITSLPFARKTLRVYIDGEPFGIAAPRGTGWAVIPDEDILVSGLGFTIEEATRDALRRLGREIEDEPLQTSTVTQLLRELQTTEDEEDRLIIEDELMWRLKADETSPADKGRINRWLMYGS